jgi:hypothetical protein
MMMDLLNKPELVIRGTVYDEGTYVFDQHDGFEEWVCVPDVVLTLDEIVQNNKTNEHGEFCILGTHNKIKLTFSRSGYHFQGSTIDFIDETIEFTRTSGKKRNELNIIVQLTRKS